MAAAGTSRRLPVIVSPFAGTGRTRLLESRLRDWLGARFDLEITCPASLDELRAAIARAVAVAPVVAVAGGDGTLHHAINAIGDAEVTLAPLPAGSGNDFCRGVGLGTSLEAAARALLGGHTRRVDLLEINGTRVGTVAGIGVVAASALQAGRLMAPRSPWRPLLQPLGPMAYLGLAGMRLLFQPRIAAQATVRWQDAAGDWQEIAGPFHGAFLAALPTLGAGLRLPVPSRMDDGQFELGLVPQNRRLRIVLHLPRLRHARPVPPDVLQVVGATRARITWAGGTPVLGDGEDLGRAEVVAARVLPRALRIVAPG